GLVAVVESGAGAEAYFSDPAYSAAGATIAGNAAATLAGAEIVLKVQRPLVGGADGVDELRPMPRGAALIGLLAPLQNPAEVKSLGASFITVDEEVARAAETAGGYAREMGEDYQRRQREKVTEALRRTDIVICTALVPGRRAPVLLTEAMVAGMMPGSVIVDLAVEAGGNVEGSRPGEIATTANGVRIVGHNNVPSRVAADASQLYARNLLATPASSRGSSTNCRSSSPWRRSKARMPARRSFSS